MAGFTFRNFNSDDDYVDMARVMAEQSDAEHLDAYPTPEWLKNFLEAFDHFDVRRDVLVVEDALKGDMVAYGRVVRMEQLDGTRRYSVAARVAPAGYAAEQPLWQWLETYAHELNAALPPNDNIVFETWALDTQTRLIAMLTHAGYAPARYGYEMTRPLDDVMPIPDFPLPDGFEIRSALPEHYRAVWEADLEAFRDHNGFAEPGESRYEAWLKDATYFQPALWKVAWHIETNEVAGMVRNYINHEENLRHNRTRGYTEDISTRRPIANVVWRVRSSSKACACSRTWA